MYMSMLQPVMSHEPYNSLLSLLSTRSTDWLSLSVFSCKIREWTACGSCTVRGHIATMSAVARNASVEASTALRHATIPLFVVEIPFEKYLTDCWLSPCDWVKICCHKTHFMQKIKRYKNVSGSPRQSFICVRSPSQKVSHGQMSTMWCHIIVSNPWTTIAC